MGVAVFVAMVATVTMLTVGMMRMGMRMGMVSMLCTLCTLCTLHTLRLFEFGLLEQLLHSLHSTMNTSKITRLAVRTLLLERFERADWIFAYLAITKHKQNDSALKLQIQITRHRILALRITCPMAIALRSMPIPQPTLQR